MIYTIAIDDEPPALKVLEEHAKRLDFISLVKTFTNPLSGIDYLENNNNISAVFLDINMSQLPGTDVAEILQKKISIIFVTAFPEHAVKGFELNALDYLLKPVSFTRFLKSCHKLRDHIGQKENEKTLFIKEGSDIVRLKSSNIYYIESLGNYLKIYTNKGTILYRETLKEFIEELPANDFVRVHKSYIVNLKQVNRIEPFQLTIDNAKIPVSINYKEELWKRLGINR